MTKVMVFTPTWIAADGNMAMRPECRASVEAQDFEGEIVWEVGTHNPHGKQTHRNVLAQYRRARELFLKSDCKALLTFEHDMAMPADGVQRLWETLTSYELRVTSDECRTGVAYGIYLLRHGSWVLNAWEYIGDVNLGESLTLYPEKLAAARKQGVVRVCGTGWGCTMISREVVEAVPFHNQGGQNEAGDLAFSVDCLYRGVVMAANMDVACDHYDGELRLRPFGGAMADTVKVIAEQDVTVMDGLGTRRLQRGQEYELGRILASDLMRAGYVVPVEDDIEADSAGSAENPAQAERIGPGMGNEPETASIEAPERTVMAKGRRRKGGL
jgi:hypothetical protein